MSLPKQLTVTSHDVKSVYNISVQLLHVGGNDKNDGHFFTMANINNRYERYQYGEDVRISEATFTHGHISSTSIFLAAYTRHEDFNISADDDNVNHKHLSNNQPEVIDLNSEDTNESSMSTESTSDDDDSDGEDDDDGDTDDDDDDDADPTGGHNGAGGGFDDGSNSPNGKGGPGNSEPASIYERTRHRRRTSTRSMESAELSRARLLLRSAIRRSHDLSTNASRVHSLNSEIADLKQVSAKLLSAMEHGAQEHQTLHHKHQLLESVLEANAANNAQIDAHMRRLHSMLQEAAQQHAHPTPSHAQELSITRAALLDLREKMSRQSADSAEMEQELRARKTHLEAAMIKMQASDQEHQALHDALRTLEFQYTRAEAKSAEEAKVLQHTISDLLSKLDAVNAEMAQLKSSQHVTVCTSRAQACGCGSAK